ncbi:MAG: FAD-dependent oxidoreductase [Opitutales bacterium]
MNPELEQHTHSVDVCVVGGGMAGLIAAVSAARRGASVVLIHDRPVLGGNASSEVRMWICGAHGSDKKEAGLLEEIQLKNLHRNPDGLYSHWDSVLFEYAKMTPGLTTLLNCSCNDAVMERSRIHAVDAWQLTTQIWHRVEAKMFIDCSGDSILAPLSGAETRRGRESREEFDEPIAPLRGDLKTMGNTTLLQIEETGKPQSFTPPDWAYHFDDKSTLPSRIGSGLGHNFWWLEIGGLADTIRNAEHRRLRGLEHGRPPSRRLVVLPVRKQARAIRWTGQAAWGADELRVFSLEAHESPLPLSEDPPAGISWSQLVADLPSEDLAAPDHGLEDVGRSSSRVGA